MQRKITKGNVSDAHKVDVVYTEMFGEGHVDEVTRKPKPSTTALAHPDLVTAFEGFRIHMAALCEEGEYTYMEENPTFVEKFVVNQITLGGEGEHEGIVISGYKKLNHNLQLQLNSPFVKFDRQHSHYPYSDSLFEQFHLAMSELDQYLNGKKAPSNQLNMFDEAPAAEAPQPPKRKKSRTSQIIEENLPNGVTMSVE